MLKKQFYRIRNKQIIAKFLVIVNYILLGFFSLLFKPLQLLQKKKIYFFQDRYFGIDNAYFLFLYYQKKHPEIDSIYLVKNKKDVLYKKLENNKGVVYNFSLKHFWYFIASEKIIYSFDTAPFYFFGKIGIILKKILKRKAKLVFLGHGVTRVHIPFFEKTNNIFDLFITCSKEEKRFLDKNSGYKNETVITGLPRFDNLYNNSQQKKQIFFFPTWDNKLSGLSNNDFKSTEYFKSINGLLKSKSLNMFLEENNYKLYYYPHQGIKKYIKLFYSHSRNTEILDDQNKEKQSISKLILESKILITNYSSVVFDFAYQLKPIIYYNIGTDHYNKKVPYYYKFGKHCNTMHGIIKELQQILDETPSEKSKNYCNTFFKNIDSKNCQRTSIIINNL